MPRHLKPGLFPALLLTAGQACGAPSPVCIGAGELRWQLLDWSRATALQVLFNYNELGPVATRGGCWWRADSALRGLLEGSPFTWDWVNERTLAVTAIGECRPDLGAAAPLPPCVQPLQVRR